MTSDFSFPSTRWSLLEQAQRNDDDGRRALELLLNRYLPALRAHLVEGRRLAADEVEDLLQSFVLDKFLQHQILKVATRDRGRFRALLVASLNNYLTSYLRHKLAQCRDSRKSVNLDADSDLGLAEPGPSRAFDIEWARAVVTEAISRMRAACDTQGRRALWGVFEARLLAAMDGTTPVPYKQLAIQFGLESPVQASNLLVTAKRLYVHTLRNVVAEYEADMTNVDVEIQELQKILANQAPD